MTATLTDAATRHLNDALNEVVLTAVRDRSDTDHVAAVRAAMFDHLSRRFDGMARSRSVQGDGVSADFDGEDGQVFIQVADPVERMSGDLILRSIDELRALVDACRRLLAELPA